MISQLPMRDAIRIVTINTWKGDGPYRNRVDVLADQLAALEPDVVACQEVFATADGGVNTAEFLANRLGFSYAFVPARPKRRAVEGRTVTSWSGLAILTSGYFVDVQHRPLPADPADGERVIQFAAIWINGLLVRIANVHLSHLAGADALRQEQLEAILADPWLVRSASARILCGDFNAEPASPPVRWLLDGCHGWQVTDCWPDESPTFRRERATMSRHNGYRRSLTRDRCLDYIVALGGREDPPARFANTRVVLDVPGATGVFPSDHFGVATTAIAPRTAGGRPALSPMRATSEPLQLAGGEQDRGRVLPFRPRRSAVT